MVRFRGRCGIRTSRSPEGQRVYSPPRLTTPANVRERVRRFPGGPGSGRDLGDITSPRWRPSLAGRAWPWTARHLSMIGPRNEPDTGGPSCPFGPTCNGPCASDWEFPVRTGEIDGCLQEQPRSLGYGSPRHAVTDPAGQDGIEPPRFGLTSRRSATELLVQAGLPISTPPTQVPEARRAGRYSFCAWQASGATPRT
jgi:hypothetical protein